MAHNKPLFVPWLRQQIDSRLYPGVQWLDREHFTIPWKHALRQDSNSDDVGIFKAWAQTSVGSEGKIQGDPSVWKRNFRSALRARNFKMVSDNKNDTANPHKIYKWPDDGQSGESKESSQDIESDTSRVIPDLYLGEDDMILGGELPDDLLQQCLNGLNIGGNEQEIQTAVAVDDKFFVSQPIGGDQYSVVINAPELQHPVDAFPVQETLENELFSPIGGAVGGVGHISPAESAVSFCQFSPLASPVVHCTEGIVLGQQIPVQVTSSAPVSNQDPTHYKVTVYYRGCKVLEKLVENEAGFRLVSRNDPNLMADGLSVLELPGTNFILDQTQARSTRDILDNLGGLEVRIKSQEGKLYGHRWGDSRVYWGLCKHERGLGPRPLSKNEPEPIYSFKDFYAGLIEYIQKPGTSSPSYSLYFFLGQNWPDPKNKPWEKKLIMVEVVLTSLEKLKLMAIENGASSLQSDELQLSLEQMMDMY